MEGPVTSPLPFFLAENIIFIKMTFKKLKYQEAGASALTFAIFGKCEELKLKNAVIGTLHYAPPPPEFHDSGIFF